MIDQFIVSSTTLINFLNASGSAKITVVSNAKEKHERDDDFPYDYWTDFKRCLIRTLKSNGTKEELKQVIEDVRDDMRPNYQEMVNGFIKFWGRKKLEWIKPIKNVITVGGLKVRINPEIGLRINSTEYFIKLHLKANDILDRKHADLVTTLMENGLRRKAGDGIVFAVLDVRRGVLLTQRDINPSIKILLKAEGASFLKMWKEL